jgi:hypothetical protein
MLPIPKSRPGDPQPAVRTLHIAHDLADGVPPSRYLCGAPVRHLLAPIRRGEQPRGKSVCQTCLMLHVIATSGDAFGCR